LKQNIEEMKTNLIMTQEELEAIEKEMRSLKHKVEMASMYHHRMEDILKMEHAFMKDKLLIYQQK
jgi:chromosome segregation ATPase